MADIKQYVAQNREKGTVLISEDVLVTIVNHAISEVEGIAGLSAKPVADIVEIIGKKNWGKGIKIVIGEQEELYVECNINIAYGQSVVTVSQNVQAAVIAALESVAGVMVASVNINVCGIVRQ